MQAKPIWIRTKVRTSISVAKSIDRLKELDMSSEKETPPQTITSTVYNQIRSDILQGRLQPKERLRVESLREKYSTSASPVREALSRLSAHDLVVNHENRGFRVPDVSRDELLELYETREWLEVKALRDSIANGDVAWEEDVVLAQHRLNRVSRCTDTQSHEPNPAWGDVHRAFHLSLIAACGSRWLIRFCGQLHDLADRYRQLAVVTADNVRDSLEEHEAIAQASTNRDADRACELLIAHYERTRDIVLDANPSVFD